MVSLIVPIYNAENTLLRCITSIQKQTYPDFEVILVDDGSVDNSLELCKRLTKDDSRFLIVHQCNSGASLARNTGIEQAKGEYICFMDSDDEIEKEYISDLVKDVGDADLVMHGMMRCENNAAINMVMPVDGLFHLAKDYISFFEQVNVDEFGGPVSKLFKKSIIERNHLRFNCQLRLAEDLDFLMRYLLHCEIVRTAKITHYRYILALNSVSSVVYPFETELNGLLTLDNSWSMLSTLYFCENLQIRHEKSLSAYVARLIPAIYHDNVPHKVRLTRYKLIEPRYKYAYKKWYVPETAFMAFRKTCFCNGCYSILDWVLKFRLNK